MPSDFMALDMGYPNLKGLDTEKKLQAMEDYLMQLLEQLRYTLHNLSTGNFNRAALEAFASSISTPVSIALKKEIDRAEGAEGQLRTDIGIVAGEVSSEVTRATGAEGTLGTRITQNADAITAEVTRATGAEGTLGSRITQNADAITAEVTRATGAEATLTLTAQGLRTDVNAASGAASSAQQTADGIKAQVTDGQGNYTVLNLKSDGLHIGNASGTSTIDGGNITANTIGAAQIVVGTIPTDTSDLTNGAGYQTQSGVTTIINNTITTGYIDALGITAKYIKAGDFEILNASGLLRGYIDLVANAFWSYLENYNINFHSYGALTFTCHQEAAGIALDHYIKLKADNGLVLGGAMYGGNAPATYFANHGITPKTGQLYFKI